MVVLIDFANDKYKIFLSTNMTRGMIHREICNVMLIGVIPHNDCEINNVILKHCDYAMFRYAQNCTYTNCVCDNLCNFNYTDTSLSVYDNDVKFTNKIISKRTFYNNWNRITNVISQVVN